IVLDMGRDPTTQKRKQQWVSVKGTKKAAEERLTELLRQVDTGLSIPKGKLTVRDWLAQWLVQDIKPYRATKTHDRYSGIVQRHLIPHIGHIRLAALAPSHVKDLLALLIGQGMAPAGVDLCRTVLHGALKAAIQQELLSRNAVDATTPPRVERSEIIPPEIKSVAGILACAEESGHPLFAALHLLAYTGARRGEILGLDWQHVNLTDGTISIVRSLGRSREGLVFGPPKTTNGRRVIDLDQRTVEVLQAHQGEQLLERVHAEGAYADNGLVFANTLGEPINPMQVTRAFQSLARQCGAGHVKLHALRHFHASVLFQQKQSLFAVSRRLGHASISTTADLYGHMLPGSGKEQANAFAEAMRHRPVDGE
ncbi:MAG: site-specific integrase, partial [Chloroflexi bacterium]|nr:site-specific integrase [Chloroflexota bacterium]